MDIIIFIISVILGFFISKTIHSESVFFGRNGFDAAKNGCMSFFVTWAVITFFLAGFLLNLIN